MSYWGDNLSTRFVSLCPSFYSAHFSWWRRFFSFQFGSANCCLMLYPLFTSSLRLFFLIPPWPKTHACAQTRTNTHKHYKTRGKSFIHFDILTKFKPNFISRPIPTVLFFLFKSRKKVDRWILYTSERQSALKNGENVQSGKSEQKQEQHSLFCHVLTLPFSHT